MADEINLGRLVAEIALDNQSLQDSAEDAIETIQKIAETAEETNPEVNLVINTDDVDKAIDNIEKAKPEVNITVNGVDNIDSAVEKIPSNPISVDVEVSVSGVDEAINSINSISSNPITISLDMPNEPVMDEEFFESLRDQAEQSAALMRDAAKASEDCGKSQEESSEKTKITTDELIKTISEQEKKLEELKKQYSDVALNQGKNSEQAQELAKSIGSLSDNISSNKDKLKEAAYNADDYKESLNDSTDATKEQEKANNELSDGFTVLKGAIADLAANALQAAIDKFGELMTSGKQALNSIQAQTGMTNAEMSKFKDEMYDLYSQNYGESLEDVANKMSLVKQSIDETDPENIKEITKNAIAMSDTFDMDFSETVRGVNALMTNMGLTAEQAFDYMSKGAQNGLNITEELGDNLSEYTQLWSQAGFSAEEMFSILQNGIDSGAYNLDKVNDLVGEMTRSIIDGRLESSLDSFSDETAQIFEAFKNGKATQSDVFNSMINDLNNTSNLAEKLATASNTWSALGEDNAMSVIQALNNVNDTYADVSGTMQSINNIKYDDVGNQLATLGRKFEVDLIQPLVEGATPALENILTWATDNLPIVASMFTSVTTAVLGYKAAVNMDKMLNTVKNSFSGLITKIKGSAAASAADSVAKTTEKTATEGAKVAQDGFNASLNANPIMLVVSLVASLAIGIGTYAVAANNATTSTEKYSKAIEEVEESAKKNIASTEAECEVIKELGKRYDELRASTNRTADEQKELDNIAEQLSKKLNITTDDLKDQSGEYINLNSQIDATITKMKELAEANANLDIMQEVYSQKSQAYLDWQEKKQEAKKYYTEYKDEIERGYSGSIILDLDSPKLKHENLQIEVQKLEQAYNECSEKAEWYSKNLKLTGNASDEASNATSKYTKEVYELNSATLKATDSMQTLSDVQKEIDDTTKTASDAFSKMVSTANALKSAEDEVAKGQGLSLNTLNSLQKSYPELSGLVNDYINGIATEADVIKGLKKAYDQDTDNYNQAMKDKLSNEEGFYKSHIANNTELVNKMKEQYDIDLTNYTSVAEAKAAVHNQVLQNMKNAMDAFYDYVNTKDGTIGMLDGKMYLIKGNGEIEVTAAEAAEFERLQKNAQQRFAEYLDADTATQGIEEAIRKAVKNAPKVTSDAVASFNFDSGGSKKSSSGKTYTTKSSDGVTGTGSTYAEANLDWLNKQKNLGKISIEYEIKFLKKLKQYRRNTADDIYDIEYQLYQAEQKLKDKNADSLNTLGDAVVNALKSKYEQQKKLEEKRIDESIESWKKWENETCNAIQGQIDALDELKNAHDEENQRQEYENKRQALELQARYEKDDYNRKQIQKEIAALDKDENERLFNLQIEQQKKALQEQMDNVKEISQNNQDSLGEKKDVIAEKYDKLTSDFALKAEAQQTILKSSQKELIKLINSYAPEYEMAGTSLGEALYNGFKSKTGNISGYVSTITAGVDNATSWEKKQSASNAESFWKSENSYYKSLSSTAANKSSEVKQTQSILDKLAARVDSLLNSISSTATAYKNQMAITANAAADRYYSTQQYYTNSTQSKVSSPTNIYMTVNFNDKVDSPIEVKRQMEYVSQQLAKQISN